MSGIPSDLMYRLREALTRCGPFDSDRSLRAAFIDARIYPWRDSIPQAESRAARVGAAIDALLEQHDAHGNPALALFVEALAEGVSPGDACHKELAALAAELRVALPGQAGTAAPTTPADPSGGKYVVNIYGGQVGVIGDGAAVDDGIRFGEMPARPAPSTGSVRIGDVAGGIHDSTIAGGSVHAGYEPQRRPPLRSTRGTSGRINLSALRELLVDGFSDSELRDLCFLELDIDYESLPGEAKAGKARELIAYLRRRNRIEELIEIGQQQRPDLPWENVL